VTSSVDVFETAIW